VRLKSDIGNVQCRKLITALYQAREAHATPAHAHEPGCSVAGRHLIGALVGADRGHRQALADRPEAQETNAKLPLQSGSVAVGFQVPFDRVTNVRGDVLEVRKSIGIARNSITAIFD